MYRLFSVRCRKTEITMLISVKRQRVGTTKVADQGWSSVGSCQIGVFRLHRVTAVLRPTRKFASRVEVNEESEDYGKVVDRKSIMQGSAGSSRLMNTVWLEGRGLARKTVYRAYQWKH